MYNLERLTGEICVQNIKIAVIDDEQGILLTLQLYLEMEGFIALVFSSPIEALKVINSENVDIIILDMKMPEMDGEELAKIFKRNQETKDIPIILFSAHETVSEVAIRVGAYGILEKPFQFEELNKMIKEIIINLK
ncbi:MAG: response regulator [Firmicutes bacterium HGW-Firmicutes-12]|jgi:DNA-binding NtrC family response regulator|nr:MAG: response regulator [Firmicutes bacterium HGW-Firmicutes-12]